MMKIFPELKRIHSPDVFDLDKPTIDENGPFCVLVQAMFGPAGSDGEEAFGILVCNSEWISQKLTEGAYSTQNHHVVAKFDSNEIRSFLQNTAKECAGSTWLEVAEKLGKIGRWEFDDYVEYRAP
jgi:hypothetical protein